MEIAQRVFYTTAYGSKSFPRIVRPESISGEQVEGTVEGTVKARGTTDSNDSGTTRAEPPPTGTGRTGGKGSGPGSKGPGDTDTSSVNRSSTLFTLFGLFAASSIATIWAYTRETIFGLSTEYLKHMLGGLLALIVAVGGAALMADHSPKGNASDRQMSHIS